MPKILIVLSGSDHWTLNDGTEHPTGFWAEELLSPLQVFSDAGFEVDLASPEGRTPVVDEGSLSPEAIGEEESAAQRKALDALAAGSHRPWSSPTSVSTPTTPCSS